MGTTADAIGGRLWRDIVWVKVMSVPPSPWVNSVSSVWALDSWIVIRSSQYCRLVKLW